VILRADLNSIAGLKARDLETAIWRDRRGIDPTDQFDPEIQRAIDSSEIFLALLSPNWLSREWCRIELERFRKRWEHEDPESLRHRIIVVSKRFVEKAKRPSLLQGQEGHSFFEFEGPNNSGMQFEYYWRGRARDDRYYNKIEEVTQSISLKLQQLSKRTGGQARNAALVAKDVQSTDANIGALQSNRIPSVVGLKPGGHQRGSRFKGLQLSCSTDDRGWRRAALGPR
jgi:hypothetical protein